MTARDGQTSGMLRVMATVAAFGLALAGCGGGDPPATGSGARTGPSAPAPGRPASAPSETLAAVQEALREADSFHIEGVQTDAKGDTRLEGDVAPDGAVRISLEQDGASAEMIILADESLFIRGDRRFWEQSEAPARLGDLLADRWARMPADDEAALLATQLRPDVLAGCLDDDLGALSSRTDRLDGEPVEVLVDEGDRPGTAPGELYVAAEGPRLPLRIRQTGPEKPGGAPREPECGSADDAGDPPTLRSDLRLSRWDEPVEIRAPAGALDLEDLARGEGARPTV